jgi:hypothetical protein
LVFLIKGEHIDYRNAKGDNLTPKGWALFGVIFIFSVLGYWWFHNQFSSLGYR